MRTTRAQPRPRRCRRSGTRSRSSTSRTRLRSTAPATTVPYPEGSDALDYELEVAAVIGAGGAIGGFTVMNDWSARDLQLREMKVGLGPAKGKDFATSLGPVVVTVDEFDGSEGEMVGARERRGALARQPRATSTTRGSAILEQAARNTTCCARATCSAPAPSAPAASSSTATDAGCSRATWSSSRSRGSACSANTVAARRGVTPRDDVAYPGERDRATFAATRARSYERRNSSSGVVLERHRHPAAHARAVRLRAPRLDQHVADPRRERQVGPVGVQVAELTPAETELDAAEAVRVHRDALPRTAPRSRSPQGYPPRMPFYQRRGDLPRKRHVVFRENGTLLTEEVMGFEGFSGLESILYHLVSPCRVVGLGEFEPIVREEWVPTAHAHRHFHTWERRADRRCRLGAAAPDVEQRRRDLALPARRGDGLLLPERRGRRGRLRPRGLRHRSRRSSATFRTRRATTS